MAEVKLGEYIKCRQFEEKKSNLAIRGIAKYTLSVDYSWEHSIKWKGEKEKLSSHSSRRILTEKEGKRFNFFTKKELTLLHFVKSSRCCAF